MLFRSEAVARTGTRRFRYLVGAAGYLFALGSAELTFGAGGFKYADETLDDGSTVVGAANELFTLSFTIDGTTATPLDPGHGGGIDLHLLNGRGWVDVSFLASRGILVAAGHCDPSLECLREACAAGLSCFTHLGNGCPHLLPRHDNVIQRVLACDELAFVTLVADGVHLPTFLLRTMLRILGPRRAIVVSDATAAAGMGPGRYRLGGQEVVVGEDGAAWSADRTHLCGSTATITTLRHVLSAPSPEGVGLDEAEIDRLLALNPRHALERASASGSDGE